MATGRVASLLRSFSRSHRRRAPSGASFPRARTGTIARQDGTVRSRLRSFSPLPHPSHSLIWTPASPMGACMRRRAAVRPPSGGDTVAVVERGSTGLVRFEVSGRSGVQLARAIWDGDRLRLNHAMRDAIGLSMAVEAVFASVAGRCPPSFTDRPMTLAVELVRSLDEVHCIEYSTRCLSGVRRRRWVPGSEPASGRDHEA